MPTPGEQRPGGAGGPATNPPAAQPAAPVVGETTSAGSGPNDAPLRGPDQPAPPTAPGQPVQPWAPPEPPAPRRYSRSPMEQGTVRMPSPLARTGCLVATLVCFGLVVLAMFAAVFVGIPVGTMAGKIQADLGHRGEIVKMDMPDGRTWVFVIRLEPAFESQATDIACKVLRTDLAGTQFAGAHFELTSRDGRVLATEQTPCG